MSFNERYPLFVICKTCKKEKRIFEYRIINLNDGQYPYPHCKNCEKEYNERHKRWIRTSVINSKIRIYNEMGGKCVCCGINEWWNLTLDRIIFNGETENSRALLYRLLKDKKARKDYQLLCMGCDSSKSRGEKCMLDHSLTYPKKSMPIKTLDW